MGVLGIDGGTGVEESLNHFFVREGGRVGSLGETVYTNPELRENLAFRTYADGIRSLVIEEGPEPRELRALVDIIGRANFHPTVSAAVAACVTPPGAAPGP